MNRRLFIGLLPALVAGAVLLPGPAAAGRRRDNEDECERIDGRLKDIETRRRIGYTPKEGRRLQGQREKLEAQRREKCR